MKAVEPYFHVVLLIMLCKVVLTFKSVDETLVWNHSTESFWAVLSVLLSCTVYYTVQGGSNVKSLWMKPWCVTIQMKAVLSSALDVVLFIILHEVVLTFESVVKSFCVITLMKAIKLYVCDNLCIIKRFVYIFLILTLSFRDLNFFPLVSLGSLVWTSSVPS